MLKRALAGFRIFDAWADEDWTVEGAAVRVSLVCMDWDVGDGPARLDGVTVDEIHTDLTATGIDADTVDLTLAARLDQNRGVAFMGDTKVGAFDVCGDLAREWLRLPLNPNGKSNAAILRAWMNGMDVTRRSAGKWIIDFGVVMSEPDAALYEAPFEYAKLSVAPARAGPSGARIRQEMVAATSGPDLRCGSSGTLRELYRYSNGRQTPFVCLA